MSVTGFDEFSSMDFPQHPMNIETTTMGKAAVCLYVFQSL